MSEELKGNIATSRRKRKKSPLLSEQAMRCLAVLILLLAFLLLMLGVRFLVAALKDYQAGRFLESWEEYGQIPSEQAWEVGLTAVRSAEAWYPLSSSELAERFGYMWQWRVHQTGPLTLDSQKQAEYARQQAIEKYREATQLRPRWPFAWTELAYAKLAAGELDDEFDKALRLGQHYGPERNPINSRLAEVGLIAWEHLSASQQQLLLISMKKAADYGPVSRKSLYTVAEKTQRITWLCKQLGDVQVPCDQASEQSITKESAHESN